MNKTTEALRTELEEQKNEIYVLHKKYKEFMENATKTILEMKHDFNKSLDIEKIRTDRVVQVLLNNLPKWKLDMKIDFSGKDCCGNQRYWGKHATYYGGGKDKDLRAFLNEVIDP